MGRTIAEALREEGMAEGKQQTLLLLLRRKFGRKVTSAIVANIERTKDTQSLDEWLSNFVDADTLEQVGIPMKG